MKKTFKEKSSFTVESGYFISDDLDSVIEIPPYTEEDKLQWRRELNYFLPNLSVPEYNCVEDKVRITDIYNDYESELICQSINFERFNHCTPCPIPVFIEFLEELGFTVGCSSINFKRYVFLTLQDIVRYDYRVLYED